MKEHKIYEFWDIKIFNLFKIQETHVYYYKKVLQIFDQTLLYNFKKYLCWTSILFSKLKAIDE